MSELSAIQRLPALALRYHGEVMNSGHFQYFCNRSEFDHHEVLAALRVLGAEATAAVLADAIAHIGDRLRSSPKTISEYLAAEAELGMEDLDTRFYQVEPQLKGALERYLEAHELEFVSWVE